ncbi:recombinase family protein [Vibrio olivae]
MKIAITKWDIVFEEDMQGIEGVSARVLLEISIYLANQESSQKSARIRASNKTMKDKGMKHIAKTPIWLARSPDRKGHEVIPQNAEIIQKIFELKLERGWGALRIMNELRELEAKGNLKGFVSVDEPNLILARYTYNDEGELVQGALNSPLAESTVNAILRNKNVIGSLNDQPIYYPPIVDEAVYL